MFNKNKIIFTNILDVATEYTPQPSYRFIPDWYKKTQPFIDKKRIIGYDNSLNETIKKCIPVFDALTSGYIIPTYCDLFIRKDDQGNIVYQTSIEINIEYHSTSQAPYHPFMNQHPYPKWLNPWGIKTPKGYSCLFIPPVHGGNKYFKIVEGIVDTDTYTSPVNFPFVLNDVNFEGLIPAGTPMVQVIPFKRESWEMQVGNTNNIKEANNVNKYLTSKLYDRYKSLFWTKKEYK